MWYQLPPFLCHPTWWSHLLSWHLMISVTCKPALFQWHKNVSTWISQILLVYAEPLNVVVFQEWSGGWHGISEVIGVMSRLKHKSKPNICSYIILWNVYKLFWARPHYWISSSLLCFHAEGLLTQLQVCLWQQAAHGKKTLAEWQSLCFMPGRPHVLFFLSLNLKGLWLPV